MIVRKDWLEASGVGDLDTLDQYEKYLTHCKDNYGAYAYLQYQGLDTCMGLDEMTAIYQGAYDRAEAVLAEMDA